MYYVYLDGDKIGKKIEKLLLEKKFKEASKLSRSLTNAIEIIGDKLKRREKIELIICGGDDIFFSSDIELKLLQGIIEKIKKEYYETTGCTMSSGVGETVELSLEKLNEAKGR